MKMIGKIINLNKSINLFLLALVILFISMMYQADGGIAYVRISLCTTTKVEPY